jgi:acyl carrier protein
MNTRELVLRIIGEIRADKELPLIEISDDDPLGEDGLGLDSLDMAILVAELDAQLKCDPFASDTPRFRTVGEFVKLYELSPRA